MKKVLIGCGIILALSIAGIVITAAIVGPKIVSWFDGIRGAVEEEIAKEKDRQKVATEWVAPVKDVKDGEALQLVPADTIFPNTVGMDKRLSTDDNAAVPDLSISLKGKHALYKVGADEVDVYAYKPTESEKQAIFTFIQGKYDQGTGKGGNRFLSNFGYRMYYVSPEAGQNHLWSVGGWLFVFRTKVTEDKEPFVLALLKAIDGKEKKTEEGGTK